MVVALVLTVGRGLHFVVVEGDFGNGVVAAATNRANGQAVASAADAVLEGDILYSRR